MAIKTINNARFCNRIDTADRWITSNPTLLEGEIGIVLGGVNGKTVAVVGDGSSSITSILDEYWAYEDKIIFLGMGAQYDMPAAGSNLGGVKNGDETITGTRVTNGLVYNTLISGWDGQNGQYIIDRLRVNQLECPTLNMVPSFKGDKIELRTFIPPVENPDAQPETLGNDKYAGIVIKNTCKDLDNKFVDTAIYVDGQEKLYITRKNIPFVITPVVGLTSDIIGLSSYYAEEDIQRIVSPGKLTLINKALPEGNPYDENGELIKDYIDPQKQTFDCITSVEISLPNLRINNFKGNYNAETNELSWDFTNGAIEKDVLDKIEVAAGIEGRVIKLEQEDVNIHTKIDEIENSMLKPSDFCIEGDENYIEVVRESDDNLTFTVNHKNIKTNYPPAESANITPGVEYVFITGISVDAKGHVTGVTTTKYIWN